jgi:anti-sigma regulatory factor (Ser/Thr protein kinase)
MAEPELNLKAQEMAALRRHLQREHWFLRGVLASVTAGIFVLCDGPQDLPPELPLPLDPNLGPQVLSRDSECRALGLLAWSAAVVCAFPQLQAEAVESAVVEAAHNALLYGGGRAEGRVRVDREIGVVQVLITDYDRGIRPGATREEREENDTTAGTPGTPGGGGRSFKKILAATNRVYVLAGFAGTTIVLEYSRSLLAEQVGP